MDHILPYLFFLSCPISMGVMMWMMMRNHHDPSSAPKSDPRVTELESQVNELRMALHETKSSQAPKARVPTGSADQE